MLQQIWDELRYVRKRLDHHVDSNEKDFKEIKSDMSDMSEDFKGHKTKLGLVFSGIGILFVSFTAWAIDHISKIGS